MVALESGQATLEVDRRSACERCEEGRGCGISILAGLFSRPVIRLVIEAKPHWTVGQTLVLAPRTQDLNRSLVETSASLLIGLFGGLILATWLAARWRLPGDLMGLLGAGLGVFIGMRYAQQNRRRLATRTLDWRDGSERP